MPTEQEKLVKSREEQNSGHYLLIQAASSTPHLLQKCLLFKCYLKCCIVCKQKVVHIITSSSRDTGFATGHLFFIITRLHWLNQGCFLVLNKEEAVDGQALTPLPGLAKYTMDGAAPGPPVLGAWCEGGGTCLCEFKTDMQGLDCGK